jgi:uncharacterized protein (TIGR03435 family)
VWKGFVSFGLVSFPVRLQGAAREKSIQFHLLQKIKICLDAHAQPGRPVIDQTGLTGNFDFAVEWSPRNLAAPTAGQSLGQSPALSQSLDQTGPSFQEALKQQLGLKLESHKGPVEVFEADHVEHPSEN